MLRVGRAVLLDPAQSDILSLSRVIPYLSIGVGQRRERRFRKDVELLAENYVERSRMSRLKVFRAAEPVRPATDLNVDEPDVLRYESHFQRWRDYRNNPVARAQSLRDNDQCPQCRRALVEPLELANGVLSRNNRPVPGTASLVGFHCLTCHWEWPA